MEKDSIKQRRYLIKTLIGFLVIAVIYLTDSIINIHKKIFTKNLKIIEISSDITEGVNIYDKIIVIKSADSINIFSSKCPHLGCQINNFQDNYLVCPCHGSKFGFDGKLISGPSIENLRMLNYKISNNKILAFLND